MHPGPGLREESDYSVSISDSSVSVTYSEDDDSDGREESTVPQRPRRPPPAPSPPPIDLYTVDDFTKTKFEPGETKLATVLNKLELHNLKNKNYECNGCLKTLTSGVRHGCLDCRDFTFCDVCMKTSTVLHPAHRFVADYLISLRESPKVDNLDQDHSGGKPSYPSEDVQEPVKDDESHHKDMGILYQCKYVDRRNITLGVYDYPLVRRAPAPVPSKETLYAVEFRREVTCATKVGCKQPRSVLERMDWDKQTIRLHIDSPLILNALRAIVLYYPGVSLNRDSLSDLTKIPRFLVHYRRELIAYKTSHPKTHSTEYQEACNAHIDGLIGLLTKEVPSAIERQNAIQQPGATISYDDLWILFKPGTAILARDGSEFDLYIVTHIKKKNSTRDRKSRLEVNAWNINFDGTVLGRCKREFEIKKFRGEQKITALPIFPLDLYSTPEERANLHEKLVNRGRMFFRLAKGPTFLEYTGVTIDGFKRTYQQTRVMCDTSCNPWQQARDDEEDDEREYKGREADRPSMGGLEFETTNLYQRCTCDACERVVSSKSYSKLYSDYDHIDLEKSDLSEHQYSLCNRFVWGFVLKERGWHLLDVGCLKEPEFADDPISQLVLEEKTKQMMSAICHNVMRKQPDMLYAADFIRGKGEGQIFLLHGPPGVGKTLTAECVAEDLKRPLLSLTGGDIGSRARDVEKNLRKYLRRGQDWNAVVLLDEADVYLGTRDLSNLERNSVVSVFLREIEYYRGILFLTTNRVGQFDEALTSRIHVSLEFSLLSEASRQKLWQNNLDRLQNERDGEIKIQPATREYAKTTLSNLDWNGREIRNAFQTAVTIAVYEARLPSSKPGMIVLKREHLEQVADVVEKFKKYIDRARHESSATIAYNRGLRADKEEPEHDESCFDKCGAPSTESSQTYPVSMYESRGSHAKRSSQEIA